MREQSSSGTSLLGPQTQRLGHDATTTITSSTSRAAITKQEDCFLVVVSFRVYLII